MSGDTAKSISRGLKDAVRIERARRFFDEQLAKQESILTPRQYYLHLADIVGSIPPFTRPTFYVFEDQPQ